MVKFEFEFKLPALWRSKGSKSRKVADFQIHRPPGRPEYVTNSGLVTGHGAKICGRFDLGEGSC
jgi:hypothetical protein